MNCAQKTYYLSIIISLIVQSAVFCFAVDLGHTTTYNANIDTQHYTNNGGLHCFNEAAITVKTIDGSGTISGNTVMITCDEFAFAGTIVCKGACTIYAKKPFDHTMFTRQGYGRFTVIISADPVEKHTEPTLVQYANNRMFADLAKASGDSIDKSIAVIRRHAFLNSLDEEAIMHQIEQEIQNRITYHAARLDQTRDSAELYAGLKLSGAGLAALAAACGTYAYRATLAQKTRAENATVVGVAFAAVVVALLPLIAAPHHFATWANPQHAKKHAALILISDRIKQSLATPYVSEDQVIKLQ